MAGDPSKATLWPDADVYVATDLTAAAPATATDPFPSAWSLVGLLDGDAGFVQARDEDTNDLYAWGGILVRTSRRNFKQTVGFTALEDNATTLDLIWPNSTATQLIVPRPKRIKIAFELRENDRIKRLISHFQAEVAIDGDITDQEADLTRYEFLATIFPDADGVLFDRQEELPDVDTGTDGNGIGGGGTFVDDGELVS